MNKRNDQRNELKETRKIGKYSLSSLACQLLNQSKRRMFLETIQLSGRIEISYLIDHLNVEANEGWDWIVEKGAPLGCTIVEDVLVVPEVSRDIFIRKIDKCLKVMEQRREKKKK